MACLLCRPGINLADATELTGKVWAGANLAPLAGAKVSLRYRSDTTYSRADGSFTLPFDLSARTKAPVGARNPLLRHGRLFVHADAGGIVYLEIFDLAGKRLASRRYQAAETGRQSLDLTAMLSGLRGLGWLRVKAGGRIEQFRVFKPGNSAPAVAGPSGGLTVSAGRLTAKQAATSDVLDTLRVEMPGYLEWKTPVSASLEVRFGAELWKNSLDGLDTEAVNSWKVHLQRPVQAITINRYSVGFPANSTGSVVVTSDGEEVERWSTLSCYPEPPPKSIRLVYTRDGKEYRDTVDLAPFWAFHESFRTRVDSLGPYDFRAYSTWRWPEGVSVLPARDVLEVFHLEAFGGEHFHSYPDVYQRGGLPTIDGPAHYFGEPNPRSGAWLTTGRTSANIGYASQFTLAQREGHDLRIHLEWRPSYIPSSKVEFVNEWPADGFVRQHQVLQLQGRFQRPGEDAYLEISETRAWESQDLYFDFAWQRLWDGSSLDWKFPFPVLDTLSVWLRVRKEKFIYCDGLDESPELRIVPDPADASGGAFEPNDSLSQAVLVGKGGWHPAALDFRGRGRPYDVDHYRFQAAGGERVRLSVRNQDAEMVNLYQDFAGPSSGLGVNPGGESSVDYVIPEDGVFWIKIDGMPGHYEFRIDTVN